MAAHRATGRTATGADRRFVVPVAGARTSTSRSGRHRALSRTEMPRAPRVVPLLAALSIAAGIVLLVPTAQAADPPSPRPAEQAQVLSPALSAPAFDAQSGTGLVPQSSESASLLAAPLPARAFVGDRARDAVAVPEVAQPAFGAPLPAGSDPANPLAAALLLIFGGGVVFAVSRARTAGGYRGGRHL